LWWFSLLVFVLVLEFLVGSCCKVCYCDDGGGVGCCVFGFLDCLGVFVYYWFEFVGVLGLVVGFDFE